MSLCCTATSVPADKPGKLREAPEGIAPAFTVAARVHVHQLVVHVAPAAALLRLPPQIDHQTAPAQRLRSSPRQQHPADIAENTKDWLTHDTAEVEVQDVQITWLAEWRLDVWGYFKASR